MKDRKIDICFISETWCIGSQTYLQDGYTVIHFGLPTKPCRRGSLGVAIILSPRTATMWKNAGNRIYHYGSRILATRLQARDKDNNPVKLFIASAYSPVSTASPTERATYLDHLSQCITACKKDEILVVGADCNASVGTKTSTFDKVLGPSGNPHRNTAGKALHQVLSSLKTCLPTTFFSPPRNSSTSTWHHMKSLRGFQIDHFIIKRHDLRFVINSGKMRPMINSDHHPIFLELRLQKKLAKMKTPPPSCPIDRSLLFLEQENPDEGWKNFNNELQTELLSLDLDNQPITLELLLSSLQKVAEKTVKCKRKKAKRQDWYLANLTTLDPVIQERNDAQKSFSNDPNPAARQTLAKCRAKCKNLIRRVKNAWINNTISKINQHNPASFWKALDSLKTSLKHNRSPIIESPPIRTQDGNLTTTSTEKADAHQTHFSNLLDAKTHFDQPTIDAVKQKTECKDLGVPFSIDELSKAISKAGNGKAAGPNEIPVEIYKAIIKDPDLSHILLSSINSIWSRASLPEDWTNNLMKVLYKKGDKHLLSNYRGITLVDTLQKLTTSMIASRLGRHLKSVGMEEQCGFTPGKSTIDGAFSLLQALSKRKEHRKDTFVVFIDLVKAFDTVPRPALFQVLKKFGLPQPLVSLIQLLYKDMKIELSVDDLKRHVNCTIGVKQGDPLSPVLFLFYIQACLETLSLPDSITKLAFQTKADGRMSGRNHRNRGSEFTFDKSCFADDCALLFDSRKDTEVGMPIIHSHFMKFGLRIHVGSNSKKSKTEFMYVPHDTNDKKRSEAAKRPILVTGEEGLITSTDSFKYLGITITEDLDDSSTIRARIVQANKTYGATKWLLCDKHANKANRVKLFKAIVQNTLLYGAEIWVIKASDRREIDTFYNKCIRAMSFITIPIMKKRHIRQSYLEQKLGVKPISELVIERQLSYVGHVFRMDHNKRLPRKFISSWLPKPRKRGGQTKTYGASVKDSLKRRGLDLDQIRNHLNNGQWWYRVRCNDRQKWMQFCRGEITELKLQNGKWLTKVL